MGQLKDLCNDIKNIKFACNSFGIARSYYYQYFYYQSKPKKNKRKKVVPKNSMTRQEEQKVLEIMCSIEYCDQSPRQIFYKLLDKEQYYCSISTMYRILRKNKAVKERRQRARMKKQYKPVLCANAPNEVWSWDISKLEGPFSGRDYSLYVVMDIFSRLIVGWTIEYGECSDIAAALIEQSAEQFLIDPDQLTLHSDRGSPMRSKTLKDKLIELGVTRSHSRPRVSNDNPFSEAQFKTTKYHPTYPGSFASIDEAIEYMEQFVNWYNNEHRHSGIAYLTPAMVHSGETKQVISKRQKTLDKAFEKHPERFGYKRPTAKFPPAKVGINLPKEDEVKQQLAVTT